MDVWTDEQAQQANIQSTWSDIRSLRERMDALEKEWACFREEIRADLKDVLPPDKRREVDSFKEWTLYNNAFDAGYAKGFQDAKKQFAGEEDTT